MRVASAACGARWHDAKSPAVISLHALQQERRPEHAPVDGVRGADQHQWRSERTAHDVKSTTTQNCLSHANTDQQSGAARP